LRQTLRYRLIVGFRRENDLATSSVPVVETSSPT
jgi:hypothetical protein